MAEINLIKIEGKPLEKLIEAISSGIGTLYKPRAIKKEAEAKAYEIGLLENAKAKAISEGKLLEVETLDRIQERTISREIRKQNNIDNISEIAAQEISQEEIVSEQPVDQDWATRFFDIAENISDEEMQMLWGKILAGEVKNPNSYSLRTLELLKNLSRKEAETFSRIANFVISSHNSPFIFKGKNENILEKYNITFEDRLLMIEVGLIQAETNISRTMKNIPTDSELFFKSGNIIIQSLKPANSPEYKINILRFTKIGEELLNLISQTPNKEYIKDFCIELDNAKIETKYAYILNENNGQFSVTQPWQKFT